MNWTFAAVAVAAGYLAGSISFARIIARLADPRADVTHTMVDPGEGRPHIRLGFVSATSVSLHLGPRLGFATAMADMIKVAIPTLIIRRAYPDAPYYLLTALAASIGHVWPVFFGFRGGRGLTAMYGGLFAIDWIGVFATSLGGMLLGVLVFRNVLIAYMGGLWLIIGWMWLRFRSWPYVAYGVAVNILFIVAVIPELLELRRKKLPLTEDVMLRWMKLSAMGRGIYKMSRRFGLLPEAPEYADVTVVSDTVDVESVPPQ
jgi:glycerol-3-phosphate acyltransferase PlsY